MKKINRIALSVALVAFVTSCGMLGLNDKRKKFTDPVAYNDYVVDVLTSTTEAWNDVLDADDQDEAHEMRDSLVSKSQANLDKLNNLAPFKKDSTFQGAARKYVTHMNGVAKNELKEFIDLTYSKDADKEVVRITELLVVLDDKREEIFDEVQDVQKKFASKHNYRIER